MPSWQSLPVEIRSMIFKSIFSQNHKLASYAAVSKEWQAAIEPQTFARLKLRDDRLHLLERLSTQRRRLVKHIWLYIEFSLYRCPDCSEPLQARSIDCSIFCDSIFRLFNILSTWSGDSVAYGKGLTLEISAHSPSDKQHYFQNCYFGENCEEEEYKNRKDLNLRPPLLHDLEHDWSHGEQMKEPEAGAILRIFQRLDTRIQTDPGLAKVYCVTRLVLRRQSRRRFSLVTVRDLLKSLPYLYILQYEPWREWEGQQECGNYEQYLRMLLWQYQLPKHLSQITIFEDFNEDYDRIIRNSIASPSTTGIKELRERVGAAFAAKSVDRLQKLSVSFAIDAKDFFHACDTIQGPWDHLRCLLLTSHLLTDETKMTELMDLLYRAGQTALRMPVLEVMALWNYDHGEACMFAYRKAHSKVHPRKPLITWRGTQDVELESRVVEAWQGVADKYTPYELRVEKHLLRRSDIESHGDAIRKLHLGDRVIDSVSCWQIRQEAYSTRQY